MGRVQHTKTYGPPRLLQEMIYSYVGRIRPTNFVKYLTWAKRGPLRPGKLLHEMMSRLAQIRPIKTPANDNLHFSLDAALDERRVL